MDVRRKLPPAATGREPEIVSVWNVIDAELPGFRVLEGPKAAGGTTDITMRYDAERHEAVVDRSRGGRWNGTLRSCAATGVNNEAAVRVVSADDPEWVTLEAVGGGAATVTAAAGDGNAAVRGTCRVNGLNPTLVSNSQFEYPDELRHHTPDGPTHVGEGHHSILSLYYGRRFSLAADVTPGANDAAGGVFFRSGGRASSVTSCGWRRAAGRGAAPRGGGVRVRAVAVG